MKQGYIPPNQEEQIDRTRKRISRLLGRKIFIGFLIVLIIIGIIGFIAYDKLLFRLLALFVSIFFGFILFLDVRKLKGLKEPVKQPYRRPAPSIPLESSRYTSALDDNMRTYRNADGNMQNKFFEYVGFHVAGVTLKKERKKIQTILWKIKRHYEPYEEEPTIHLKLTKHEGVPAIEVWANEDQIGHVPKTKLDFLLKNWNRIQSIEDFSISGGGVTEKGERIDYRAFVGVKLKIKG